MLKTKVVMGSVVIAVALGLVAPASAYRGPPRATDIDLELSSTELTQGEPVAGTVGLSWTWTTEEGSGEFEECPIYLIGACFPGHGRLTFKIGEKKGGNVDWLKDGSIKELGSFEIPFNPDDLGDDHPYVLRMRFRDAFGGPIFYGSSAKKTFYVYR